MNNVYRMHRINNIVDCGETVVAIIEITRESQK